MRILQVYAPQVQTWDRYRVLNVREMLQLAGHESDALKIGDVDPDAPETCFDDRDLLILHRTPWNSRVEGLIAAAREASAAVAFEADDLVFVPGLEPLVDGVRRLPLSEQKLFAEGLERYAATYLGCDAFIASTRLLASLRPYGPKASYVIPNVLGRDQVEAARSAREARDRSSTHEGISIGFGAGTSTHDRDLATVAPALRAALERFPEVQLELVGPIETGDIFTGFEDRLIRHPLLPWEQWWELLATFDIALAPLDSDNLYCRSKSGLKYLEAGIVGVALVASDIDGFADLIEDGRTGLLATTREDWVRAIASLIEDPGRRADIARAAHQHVSSCFTAETAFAATGRVVEAVRDGKADLRDGSKHLLDLGWRTEEREDIEAAAREFAHSLDSRGHRSRFLAGVVGSGADPLLPFEGEPAASRLDAVISIRSSAPSSSGVDLEIHLPAGPRERLPFCIPMETMPSGRTASSTAPWVDDVEGAIIRGVASGRCGRAHLLDHFHDERDSWVSLAEGAVSQDFCASRPGLSRISVALGTFDRVPGDVRFRLFDRETGRTWADQIRLGPDVLNYDWCEFEFQPPDDSASRQFEFVLQMNRSDSDPVAVLLSDAPAPRVGALRVAGIARGGSVCFKTHLDPNAHGPETEVSPAAQRIAALLRTQAEKESWESRLAVRLEAVQSKLLHSDAEPAGFGEILSWIASRISRSRRPR